MKYKKALVTGGAGFIGSHIAKKLVKMGIKVVVIDNLSMGNMKNVPPEADFVKGDILDKELVKKLLSGVDIVFHEAAVVSIRISTKEFYNDANNNLMGTLSVLEACRGSSVKKIVYASSMAVYGDSTAPSLLNEDYIKSPISPYGISKLAGEMYCLNIGKLLNIDVVALRYFNTYGPAQAFTPYVGVITIFINRLLSGKSPVIFGDGEQRRDFVHVDDIVQANIKAMESDVRGESFNVGTGIDTSVNEIAALLCKRINPGIKPVYDAPQPGELRNSIADISKAKSILKFSPGGFTLKDRIDEIIEEKKSLCANTTV